MELFFTNLRPAQIFQQSVQPSSSLKAWNQTVIINGDLCDLRCCADERPTVIEAFGDLP